jgi:thiaminase/transcriptional activator TenA
MSNFSASAWSANLTLYEQILAMPFNQQLCAGTLSEIRFQHYIVQDAHSLEGFARALALAAAKAPNADQIVHFAGAAQTAILVERNLHSDFFDRFGIMAADFAAARPTPACDHYVSYLLRVAALDPFEVALAALLPCFWVYREVGKHIHAEAAAGNPYQTWIDTYAGEDFEQAVDAVIAASDEAAATASPALQVRMYGAFTRAVQLEWMFWDSAYREATWPVG